jgi:hypothetical protein
MVTTIIRIITQFHGPEIQVTLSLIYFEKGPSEVKLQGKGFKRINLYHSKGVLKRRITEQVRRSLIACRTNLFSIKLK